MLYHRDSLYEVLGTTLFLFYTGKTQTCYSATELFTPKLHAALQNQNSQSYNESLPGSWKRRW